MPTKRFNERKKLGCMSVWLGGIFLKDEGGYEIVLKSLMLTIRNDYDQ